VKLITIFSYCDTIGPVMGSSVPRLDLFFAKFKPLHYKKGETILRAGDPPAGVLYLKKGFIRLYSISRDGEELTLIIFKQGDFFPIMWAINATPNTYFLEAMTPVVLWRSPREKFLEFVQSDKRALFELTSMMLTRFGGLLTRMEYLVFGNAINKVASILLICAERFGKKKGRTTVIQAPLIHSDIASLVGITRETASIEMKKLEKEGAIAYRGHLLVIKSFMGLKKHLLSDTYKS